MPTKPEDLNNLDTREAEAELLESEKLNKFRNEDGTLDLVKLSQGYVESEKMAHEATTKRAEAERAYQLAVAEQDENRRRVDPYGAGGDAGEPGRYSTQQPTSPDEAELGTEEYVRTEDAQPVIQAIVETVHPEISYDFEKGQYKDPEFMNGLKLYVARLPMNVKQSIRAGSFESTDWAIRQYKLLRGKAQEPNPNNSSQTALGGPKPNFSESSSSSQSEMGGKIWSKKEIKDLYTHNRAEYARRADEISKAYEEKRVKD